MKHWKVSHKYECECVCVMFISMSSPATDLSHLSPGTPVCTHPHTKPLPAGGAGEVGSVVDRGDRLVHERVGFDEGQGVIGEGGGGLVGSG